MAIVSSDRKSGLMAEKGNAERLTELLADIARDQTPANRMWIARAIVRIHTIRALAFVLPGIGLVLHAVYLLSR